MCAINKRYALDDHNGSVHCKVQPFHLNAADLDLCQACTPIEELLASNPEPESSPGTKRKQVTQITQLYQCGMFYI